MTEMWVNDDPADPDHVIFEGYTPRTCGEHRSVGYRAWCSTCSEWCYPNADFANQWPACAGCCS